MALADPRTIPAEMIISNCDMKTQSQVAVSKSPFTGEEQVQAHQGQWWEAKVTVAPCERADAAPIQAWLASMNGREKTVLFGDPAATTPRGEAATTPGTPVVNGASQTGDTLICDGAPNGVTGYLKAGDYIQLGSGSTARLHMVLEGVDSDGAGNFTLTIWPNLRSSPADGATVTVSNAQGLFRLANNMTGWSESTILYGFSFELREAL